MNPVSVLLVLDEPMEIMKSRRSMDAINIPHDIIEINNGEDALMVLGELVKNNSLPDIIFPDIKKSKINGFEFLKIIKNLGASPRGMNWKILLKI